MEPLLHPGGAVIGTQYYIRLTPNATDAQLREIILHGENRSAFVLMVETALNKLSSEFQGKLRSFQREEQWKPLDNKVLRWSASLEGFVKCIYSPILRNELNFTEERFAQYLEAHPSVIAWLKNGDVGTEHFAIPYDDCGKTRLFFPDFLAVLTEGRFGIWDTKSHGKDGSANYSDAALKAQALVAYRQERNSEGTTVEGGIVVENEQRHWTLHDDEGYRWSPELKGWRAFADSL